MKETLKQFVSRWQKSEPRPWSYYVSAGKISYGETIMATWSEIEPYLHEQGFLIKGAQSVNQIGGPDLRFYGRNPKIKPLHNDIYHVFLQLKGYIMYVGTMYIRETNRPNNVLYGDMEIKGKWWELKLEDSII